MCVSLRKIFMSHMVIVFHQYFFLLFFILFIISSTLFARRICFSLTMNARVRHRHWSLMIGFLCEMFPFFIQQFALLCWNANTTTSLLFYLCVFISHKSFVRFYAMKSWSAHGLSIPRTHSHRSGRARPLFISSLCCNRTQCKRRLSWRFPLVDSSAEWNLAAFRKMCTESGMEGNFRMRQCDDIEL